MTVPYNISAGSLTFFAKGRPWDVPADHENFGEIRSLLLAGQADRDQLVELADIRVPIIEASKGQLEFLGDQLVYAGQILHGVWVDKILAFKAAGDDFAAIFNALDDLQKNPTPQAIERLPIFVEQSKLGFLPDGRITGFKKVRHDYKDGHTGTFDNAVGAHVEIPREQVDPDPDQSCSSGLHIGALGYVKDFGCGYDDRIMLVAFWPRDAVAVPRDYNGSKLRVTAYDVIDELDKAYVDEFLGRNQTVVRGYVPETPAAPVEPPAPEPEAAQVAQVGDKVLVDNMVFEFEDTVVEVVAIDPEADSDTRLKVKDPDDTKGWVNNDDVVAVVTNMPAFLAQEGDQVVIKGDSSVHDGTYTVEQIDVHVTTLKDARVQVIVPAEDEDGYDEYEWVLNKSVVDVLRNDVSILPKAEAEEEPAPVEDQGYTGADAYALASLGDLVKLEGHAWLEPGWFEVTQVSTYVDPMQRLQIRTPYSGNVWVNNELVKGLKHAQAPVALEAWQAAKVGDTVRIEGSMFLADGEYVVTRIDDGSINNLRVAVRTVDREVYWVHNGVVKSIV
jgi:hypothetical protein